MPELYKRLPIDIHDRLYVEPFMGGGALFFALEPRAAILGDLNLALVQTYQEVRYETQYVIDLLRGMQPMHSPEFYAFVRSLFNQRLDFPSPLVAAWFLYLNKTCFNGLYRVNKRGEFNVPIGSYANPRICDEPVLREAARVLRQSDTRLLVRDFTQTCEIALGEGRPLFVYFDPPYAPLSATSDFTAYTSDGFDAADQVRLRGTFAMLDRLGMKCMLSNHDVPLIRELYASYRLEVVAAPRSISATGDRAAVPEVIVRNY